MAKGGSHRESAGALDSMDALRRRVPSIVKRVNEDPGLALRAAANPLAVLDALGIELTERLRREVELRVRFRPGEVVRLQELRAEIERRAGESFDPDDMDELERVLFERLKLAEARKAVQPVVIARAPVAYGRAARPSHALVHEWAAPGQVRRPDPLEPLRHEHPVMPPLLEYRALQATQPPLAGPDLLERLARGESGGPRMRIRARLKRGPTPE